MFTLNSKIETTKLYFSVRDQRTLVVAADAGTWIIADDNKIPLLRALQEGIMYRDLIEQFNDDSQEINEYLSKLFSLGFIKVDNRTAVSGKDLYETIIRDNQIPNLCILHVSNSCNLRCQYCYAHTEQTNRRTMDIQVVRKAIDRFFELDTSYIKVEFHGGEPLLQFKIINQACQYAVDLAQKTNKQVGFSIQSNLTFLNEECIRMLKQYNIDLRISLDGSKEDNDFYRVDQKGSGTFDNIINNLSLLNQNMIYPEVVAVVSNRNVDNLIDMFQLFAGLNLNRIRLIPLWAQGMGNEISDAVVPQKYLAHKYIELLEWVLDYNLHQADTQKRISMYSLQKEIEALTSFRRSYMCLRCPCGAGMNMVDINIDGNIYPCEEMNEIEDTLVGNIFDGPIMKQYANSDVVRILKSRFPDHIPECCDCPWKRHCQSGCANKNYQFESYKKSSDAGTKTPSRYESPFETKSDKCEFYKLYFEELIWFMDRHKYDYQAILH